MCNENILLYINTYTQCIHSFNVIMNLSSIEVLINYCNDIKMLFQIIERHITLDRNMKGSDHICSLDPSQFSKLVRDIRYIESNLAI